MIADSHNLMHNDRPVTVQFKRMKTIRLTVKPPKGELVVSAPIGTPMATLQRFIDGQTAWIAKHQQRLQALPATPVLRYTDGETHALWGASLPLQMVEGKGRHYVRQVDGVMQVHIAPNSTLAQRKALMEAFYRDELRRVAQPMMEAWADKMAVAPNRLFVQRMKTRWGSCNISKGNIRLNTELARKPQEVLEMVVVHELVHLLERNHTKRFYGLMDRFLPDWRARDAQLTAI